MKIKLKKQICFFLVLIIYFFSFGFINIPIYKLLCEVELVTLNSFDPISYIYFFINICEIGILSQYGIINSNELYLNIETCKYLLYMSKIEINNFVVNEQNSNIIELYLNATVSNINLLEFESLQKKIYIHFNDTTLTFYRIYNPTNYIIYGTSIYLLFPNDWLPYFFKIQCFCFDEFTIHQFESNELPVLFYIQKYIKSISFISKIKLDYIFFLNI